MPSTQLSQRPSGPRPPLLPSGMACMPASGTLRHRGEGIGLWGVRTLGTGQLHVHPHWAQPSLALRV